MLLTIDVGNTHTVLGLFDGEEIVEHWRISTDARRTADELAVLLQGLMGMHPLLGDELGDGIDGIAICSTVPSVLHELREVTRRYYGDVPAVLVEPGVKTGVPILMDNPKEVGADRIINAVAAVELYGGPGDRRRLRHGDHLRRGLRARRVRRRRHRPRHRDLRRGARRQGRPAPQDRAGPAAQRHRQEHRRGHAVRHPLRLRRPGRRRRDRMARELADDPDDVTVIATGGLAPMVLGEASVIDEHEPWLTLIGLRLVYERNVSRS